MKAKPTRGYHIVSFGRVAQLAPPRAGIPLPHRCRRALRGMVGLSARSRSLASLGRIFRRNQLRIC
eukprot:3711107-Pyramimonas_sp.AAC.1